MSCGASTSRRLDDEHLLALDVGLPVDELRRQIREILSGQSSREEVVVDATDRRGKAFQCRVTLVPLGSEGDGDGDVAGVIMMMEAVGG